MVPAGWGEYQGDGRGSSGGGEGGAEAGIDDMPFSVERIEKANI